jgi:hypothetical protein
MTPNAHLQPLPETGVRYERSLEAVRWKEGLGFSIQSIIRELLCINDKMIGL